MKVRGEKDKICQNPKPYQNAASKT